jgi:hypothetical protein
MSSVEKAHGGRFVPKGVKAVYASLEEETAAREVLIRRTALQGRHQINLRDYPRMMYLLSVETRRNLDLSGNLPSDIDGSAPGFSLVRILCHRRSPPFGLARGSRASYFPRPTVMSTSGRL